MANSTKVAAYANKFPVVRKKWNGTHVSKPNGEWNKTAEVMMLNFAESGHPVFRATSASGRVELKARGVRK